MRKFIESPLMALSACICKLFFLVSIILSTIQCDCHIGKLNLDILNGYVWDARGPNATFQLSPCNTDLHQHPSKSFVAITDNGETSALGLSSNPVAFTENPLKHETQVTYTGDPCGSDTAKAIVYYKCGLTLGSPEYLDQYSCATYFEWVTSAACTKDAEASETKCYLHDTQGRKYDLSPLIKQYGAHTVQTKNGDHILINICRDITPDDASNGCNGSSACIVTNNGIVKLGVPSRDNPLQKTPDDKLHLQYTNPEKPALCENNPKTDITFICKRRAGFTENKLPTLLLSDATTCQYSIVWETEYACSEDYISVTDGKCGFSLETHDINLDLSSLNVDGRISVVGANTDGSKNYTYFLNVCGDIGQMKCGQKHVTGASACQEDPESGNTYILGMSNKQRIRYADGSVQLIYKGGDYCHGSELHRSTIINFHCGHDAGVGSPVFSGKDGCDNGAYIFDWTTSATCLDTGASTTLCEVTQGDSTFDLSPLNTGHNVEVLMDDSSWGSLFMSVCGNIIQEGMASACPSGAAICLIDSTGTAVNYGKFTQAPQFKGGKLQIVYNNGNECNKGQHSLTSVLFKCSPGVMDSSPRLKYRTEDSCELLIEWDTAAACELRELTGSDCKIHDSVAGLNFDLSMLKSENYLVHNNISGHDYYINVCDAVEGSPCDFKTAVCQVDTSSKQTHDCGQPSSNLNYYNGIINITYGNGELYHNPAVPRKTQIAFLCNEDSGVGQPEFLTESDHTYSFRWSTAYACPLRSVPCAVVNGTNQYDLSRLTKINGEVNWFATEQSGSIRKTYYINVCGPVNSVDNIDCEPFAAVCGTQFAGAKEEMRLPNLGQAVSGPVVISDTHLLLNYTGGSECTLADGSKSKYYTEVHLHCNPGFSEDSGPEFETNINNCAYSLRWDTPLACPLVIEEGNSSWPCTLKDPTSGHVVNLNPLGRKTDIYTVQGPAGSSNFSLNICGPVNTCAPAYSANQAAACHDGHSIGDLNTNIERSPEGMVTMTYWGKNEDQTKTIVEFPCNASIPLGTPKFNRLDESTYYFLFETSLTCEPRPLECRAFDVAGGEYDLTPLKKNWLVLDTRPEHSDLKYYISICGPLTSIPGVRCSSGAVAGCQVNSDGTFYSLGYSKSEPVATAPKTLTLNYRGGDICHKGKPNENFRSVRLILECSTVEHDPVFIDETSECEYIINWKTVSACPLRTNLGSNCIVEDPLLHHSFDLSALTNAGTADYQVTSGNDEFYINVCGDIRQQNGACGSGVGACVKSAGNSVAIGNANQNLSYFDGTLRLEYVDPKIDCGGDKHRTTTLMFKCDHKKTGHEGPVLSAVDDDRCSFFFDWWTSLACLPFQLQECSVRDSKGHYYDFSTLTRTQSNYRLTSDTDDIMFVINVCTTLVHEPDALCPPNTAACKVNRKATDPAERYISIGELGSHMLQIINDRPVLTYENGQECNGGQKSRAIITLSCAPHVYETRPTFDFAEGCDYYFNWDTPAACALNKTSDDGCTVQNPVTGRVFDLSSYQKESGYTVQDEQNHSIVFNVCGQVKNSPCETDSIASCQFETDNPSKNWSAGTPNSMLTYVDGVVTLQYTGGQVCKTNNQSRTTILSFECGVDVEGQGHPMRVNETEHCTYLILWPTSDLCEEQVSCSVLNKDGNLVDLSLLNSASGHHIASSTMMDWEYYINICGEIHGVTGCAAQSSSCRAKSGQPAEDLGHFTSAPQLDEATGEISLLMEGGKTCDGDKKWKTLIRFSCRQGSDMGVPIFENVDASKCEYIFTWQTNVVCSEKSAPVVEKDCRYVDPTTKAVYDFSNLHDETHEVSSGQGIYRVTACGALSDPPSGCENSAVCLSPADDPNHGKAFGYSAQPKFISEGRDIKMMYEEGAVCDGTKKSAAYFIFACAAEANDPYLFSEEACVALFKWKTPLACPPVVKECVVPDSKGHLHDLRPLSFSNNSWIFSHDSDKYWMNLCRGVNNGPAGCHHNSIVCQQNGDKVHSLGVVNTQKMTWDDSKSAVVLEYYQGDASTCTSNTPASITISMLCGNDLGQPVLTNKDESRCHFSFEWKTFSACYEKRIRLSEKDWKVHDPQTNGYFDLNLLDLKQTYRVKGDDFSYILHLDSADSAFPCPAGTAVCQVSASEPGRSTILAKSSTRKFFFLDETLQLEYDSQSPCNPASSSGERAKSVINFHCVEGSTDLGEPSFVDRSEDCLYTFDWYTPVTCMSYNSRGVDDTGASSPSSKTVAVVVSCFLGMIIVAILAIVFHKAERRKRLVNRIRVAFARRSTRTFRYSQLNALDENEDENTLLGGAVESNTEYGLNRHGDVQDFHDDSDEDMLL